MLPDDGPDHPCIPWPFRRHIGDDHVFQPRPHHAHNGKNHDLTGKRHHYVAYAHKHIVDTVAEESGGKADARPQPGGYGHGKQGQKHRGTDAVNKARKHVTPKLIRSKGVVPAPRREFVPDVDKRGIGQGKYGSEEAQYKDNTQEPHAKQRYSVSFQTNPQGHARIPFSAGDRQQRSRCPPISC